MLYAILFPIKFSHIVVRLIAVLLLAGVLQGCAPAPPASGELFRAKLRVVNTENLQVRGQLVAAVREGVGLNDAWQNRVVYVECMRSENSFSEQRLAVAPPGMTDLHYGDHLLISKGIKGLEQGKVSRILKHLPPPTPDQLMHERFGRNKVSCQDEGETLHVQASSFIYPLKILEAELSAHNPLRGMNRTDLEEGRIVSLTCSIADGINPLFYYARLPEGVSVKDGDYVEAIAGRYELNWQGGPVTPFTMATPESLREFAEQHWPVELSRVIRVLDQPPRSTTRHGTPICWE